MVVPNWNGERWIARCLSSLQISARALGEPFELIVVDDASDDDSPAMIRRQFPAARLLARKVNGGFARAINRGARAARGKYLLLANNDLSVNQDFVGRLVECLERGEARGEKVFGVSAKTVGWYDGRPNQLAMGARWQGGRVTPAWRDCAKACPCLFVQAGAALYDLRRFRRLGGLSTIYEPGYWEDYDLSWRAARRGWAQHFEPAAFALHVGGGSMSRRFGAEGVRDMKARNHLLFEMIHLRSPRLLAEWSARLPLGLARDMARGPGPGGLVRGVRGCLPRMTDVLRARHDSLPAAGGPFLTDEEILAPWKDFRPSY